MYEPVRNIGVKHRGVTGRMPKMGDFESTLERDFMEIMRFDKSIESFKPQPVKIEYIDKDGRLRTYTPDGLIIFQPHFMQSNILVEIKYRQDFRENWRELMPKFRAAKIYCQSLHWQFHIYTERHIRTPYLYNAKFLWAYRERNIEQSIKSWVLQILEDLDETDPDMLLHALYSDPKNRAAMIPVIWHLIAIGKIGCDLDEPLTMQSTIWSVGRETE